MNKYNCTVIFDASSTVFIEAKTPEEAAQIAEDKTAGNQHLCHQCADTLETGDCIGVHVYDEDFTQQLLDTTCHPLQRKPLTEAEIFKALESDIEQMELVKQDPEEYAIIIGMARAIEKAHGIGDKA